MRLHSWWLEQISKYFLTNNCRSVTFRRLVRQKSFSDDQRQRTDMVQTHVSLKTLHLVDLTEILDSQKNGKGSSLQRRGRWLDCVPKSKVLWVVLAVRSVVHHQTLQPRKAETANRYFVEHVKHWRSATLSSLCGGVITQPRLGLNAAPRTADFTDRHHQQVSRLSHFLCF